MAAKSMAKMAMLQRPPTAGGQGVGRWFVMLPRPKAQ
jgi:hypothetical protein